MLQSRIRTALAARDPKSGKRESGFTLIELLVVMIIIGILSSIAIPVFLGQRQRAYDSGVQSDLKNLATAAETAFATNLSYPSATNTFASNGTAVPIISKGTTYVAYVSPTGPTAGYIIYGTNSGSDKVWVLSSYNGGAPTDTGAAMPAPATAPDAAALTALGAPTGTVMTAPGVTFTNP